MSSPSFTTSKIPPPPLMSFGRVPVCFSIAAARLEAFGS
jgi:hypothetical protein